MPNPEDAKTYNFDHPDALDFDKAYDCLISLLNLEETEIPIYDFKLHKRFFFLFV